MSDNKPATDALRRARALIENPQNWTTGTLARNDADVPEDLSSHWATKWCGVGAVRREAGPYWVEALSYLAKAIREDAVLASAYDVAAEVARFNDAPRRSHKTILAKFDKAIAKAEGTN